MSKVRTIPFIDKWISKGTCVKYREEENSRHILHCLNPRVVNTMKRLESGEKETKTLGMATTNPKL